jgi:broad specificity phosphatase PhoE
VCTPIPRWQAQLQAGQSVLVVTSAGVISTILADVLGEDLAWQRQTNVALYNASVSILDWDQSRWQLHQLNCTAHLAADERTMA